MTRRERLRRFLQELCQEHEIELEGALRDETPLISSGTLDSLAILGLAEWIDAELDGGLDLDATDVPVEWDSIDAVLLFIEERA